MTDRSDTIRSIGKASPEMRRAGAEAIKQYLEGAESFDVVASAVWSAMYRAWLNPKAPGSVPGLTTGETDAHQD